jgi:site-specific DNA-methyltransferase (adenine-specific)
MARIPEASLHAIVTDPPYGGKEFDRDQLEKREQGRRGTRRVPPSFDGHRRSLLPRFTALNQRERDQLRRFFREWGKLACRVLRPGGHLVIAGNAFLAQLVFAALVEGGLSFRGELIRLVRTLRGGDRPKHAEQEFPEVSSLPRGGYEPWGLFRKPLPTGLTVRACLRQYQTGSLRRRPDGRPFVDVIASGRPEGRAPPGAAPQPEAAGATPPARLGGLAAWRGNPARSVHGLRRDRAAAEALGLTSIGVERHRPYFEMATAAIMPLSTMYTGGPQPGWKADQDPE